jgi:multiple sugar transport system ATP-binding protein
MRTEIKALHQRLKTTTVYVTHDQVEAMTMADRIAVMNAGLVEQIGTPLDLYDRPANLFVAEFIGSPAMNNVRGTVHWGSGDLHIRSSDGRQWPLRTRRTLKEGAPIIYGVRPEHLVLVDSADKSAMDAEVILVEPTGASTEVVVQIGSSTLTMSTAGRPSIAPGDKVHLAPLVEHVHLFDPDSGVRLSD